MADLKQLKAKPLDDFRESDPLAELTRIMGLNAQSSTSDGAMDDFGIDLERELLGDFGDPEPAANKDAPAFQPDEDMFVGDDHVPVEAASRPAFIAKTDYSSIEIRPRGEPILTLQPARPALRVVEQPAESREAGPSSDDQSLEDELESLLSMDASQDETPEHSNDHSASPVEPQDASEGTSDTVERDDPLDRLEAFSKDWFARRQAQQEGAQLQPQASDAGDDLISLDDLEDFALVEESVAEHPQDHPTSYIDEVPAEAEILARHEDQGHQEPGADLTPEPELEPESRFDPEPQVASAPVVAAPRPAFDPSADPFADLMAMSRPASATEPQTPAEVAESEPETVPDVRGTWATSEEGPRYVPAGSATEADVARAEAEVTPAPQQPVAEDVAPAPLQRATPSRFSIGRATASLMPAAAPVETASVAPAPEPFAEKEPAPQVETESEDFAFDDLTLDDGDFDLGNMLEAELAAEAEQIAFRANPAPQQALAEAAADGPAARQPMWGDFGEPDIDTIEVPVTQVDVADEFDIPDLVFEEDTARASEEDELDLEFASAFEDLAGGRRIDPATYEPRTAAAFAAPAAEFQAAPAVSLADGMQGRAAAEAEYPIDDLTGFWEEEQGADGYAVAEPETARAWADDAYGQAPHDAGDFPSAFYADGPAEASEPAPRRRRGLAIAAVVAGVAVAGGIGAFMLSFGGGDNAAPVLVEADPTPVKIKPEKPGGTIIPNEDKAVYDRVASGGENAAPAQEKLLSASEEPIDIVAKATPVDGDTSLPGVESPIVEQGEPAVRAKGEDRVEQEIEDPASPVDEIATVTPRKVRTLIVRPDGTLVPREEPAAAEPQEPIQQASLVEPAVVPEATFESTEESQAPAQEATQPPPAGVIEKPAEQEAAQPAASEAAPIKAAPAADTSDTAPVRVVESTTIKPDGSSTPARGPLAPTRPSDQPVEIVGSAGGNQRGTQVAAAPAAAQVPAIPAGPTSEWSMQIASQPSPEGAQKSYVNLAQRYGSILGGRGVNIVKADIAGKGTFWRVRIPAQSKADAVELCERLKAAGGSCFVAR
ncbi:SPOR domain-containing protein [Aquibium oceanicum]|uniref:SPOR domain-containing protein n=1 Tax=Aquibium oceanicum TaxID=1670800 RepID=A0A1L3SS49_9HYPH|nr:SPOR domain-containing protein [Aquibium oceanicum]APH72238.1 hypothetical protein BSQ44_13340 [Aquibium oceanicum]